MAVSGETTTISSSPAMESTEPTPQDSAGICNGDIRVSQTLPSKKDLAKCDDLPVVDSNGKSYSFKSLYSSGKTGRRVLILFIRHFFCGVNSGPSPKDIYFLTDVLQNCQEYLRTLCSSISPDSLLSLPTPTELVIIGCGKPNLIPFYVKETSCLFPVYCDPSKVLYAKLGMTRTLDLGPSRPDYMQRSLLSVMASSFIQSVKAGTNIFNGGDYWQVGGEFLFEDGQVKWCHRMKNTRDHAEVTELRRRLGLDDERPPVRKRWSTNLANSSLGRSLSNKRHSWSQSRSQSRRRRDSPEGSKEGSLMENTNAIKEVKEEMEKEETDHANSTIKDAAAGQSQSKIQTTLS
ncbi:hypothetical protein MMC14_001951 [Varicellaria rhodocarpa]|nr:hypothetical protein [Varicellaria rhodocarpa]